MPEGPLHRKCKDVLAKLIKAPPKERLIKKGIRADRADARKRVKLYGEVDCTHTRGRSVCVITVYAASGKRLRSVLCPAKWPRRRRA